MPDGAFCLHSAALGPAPLSAFVKHMSAQLRRLIRFTPIVALVGIYVGFSSLSRSPVTLKVTARQGNAQGRGAFCEIQNSGYRPVELWVHSLDHQPFYHRLQRLDGTWRPVGWDIECGLDAQSRFLAPAETLRFIASLIDTSQPIRIALNYRLDGVDYAVSTKTIVP
jgi:hypothetical protein